MNKLQDEFDKAVDGLPRHHFKRIKKNAKAAIYERSYQNRIYAYEVFKIEKNCEYPTFIQFGKSAWLCSSLERAKEIYKKITAGDLP